MVVVVQVLLLLMMMMMVVALRALCATRESPQAYDAPDESSRGGGVHKE
jgi:hypothetical protein